MADDREVLREVWDGRIPACFTLASSEVETLTAPDPYYLMLPRQSLLPVVTDKVKKHFSKFVSSALQDNVAWFESAGAPLKWHLPIGVLFDMEDSRSVLPWAITVHFDKFPSEEILRYDRREDVELSFMSSLKEADQLKHGGKVVSLMEKKDHKQLWQGLHNDKFDQFWAVNRKLMESLPGDDGAFKHLPLRLFDGDRPMLQKLYKTVVKDEDGNKRNLTLGDLLKEALGEVKASNARAVTQGVEPPLDTPLQWMSEHLSYPDNFLYICVK